MDVAVSHKRGKRLSSLSLSSVIGDGLLERARATSLGLLGITAAVGLAIVALAFNQGWPLVAGSPVPALPPLHQDVGKATVADAASGGARSDAKPGSTPQQDGAGGESARPDTGPAPSDGASPAPSSQLVVAPSAPAKTDGDAPRGEGSNPEPAPAKPKQPSPSPSPDQPPATQQAPAEPAPAAPEPEPTSPPATISEAPPTSNVPPWSNGKGHAYGRSGKEVDD
jgi:hypothetical protein